MSDTQDSDDKPILPLELERVIVDMVVEDIKFPLKPQSGATYLNVQLTAKRFRDWIMPVIFRVLDTDTIARYTQAIRFDFVENLAVKYGKATRQICYVNDSGSIIQKDRTLLRRLLENCPNVTDLALSTGYEFDTLPFLHSSIENLAHLECFWGRLEDLVPNRVLSPVYLNLTHLGLTDPITFPYLAQFHNLVHLCVTDSGGDWNELLTALSCHKGEACRSLQFITGTEVDIPISAYYQSYNNADERFVELHFTVERDEIWYNRINGGVDLWEFSKRIVIARNRGYLTDAIGRAFYMGQFPVDELNEKGQRWLMQLDESQIRRKGQEWWLQTET